MKKKYNRRINKVRKELPEPTVLSVERGTWREGKGWVWVGGWVGSGIEVEGKGVGVRGERAINLPFTSSLHLKHISCRAAVKYLPKTLSS